MSPICLVSTAMWLICTGFVLFCWLGGSPFGWVGPVVYPEAWLWLGVFCFNCESALANLPRPRPVFRLPSRRPEGKIREIYLNAFYSYWKALKRRGLRKYENHKNLREGRVGAERWVEHCLKVAYFIIILQGIISFEWSLPRALPSIHPSIHPFRYPARSLLCNVCVIT